jgi:site-specific recombinase XerD
VLRRKMWPARLPTRFWPSVPNRPKKEPHLTLELFLDAQQRPQQSQHYWRIAITSLSAGTHWSHRGYCRCDARGEIRLMRPGRSSDPSLIQYHPPDQRQFERHATGRRLQESELVFVSAVGTPLDPRNVPRIWHGFLAEARLERCAFHVSRHTAVGLLIAEGVQLKVIQEVVGHSLLSTTADIYRHLFPQAFAEAADAMDRALG